jgi:hypothetical protein
MVVPMFVLAAMAMLVFALVFVLSLFVVVTHRILQKETARMPQ